MEGWHKLRLDRAKTQMIYCEGVESTDSGYFLFAVHGSTGQVYTVAVHEDISKWPPICDCNDSFWREGILCKHVLLCLRLMNISEAELQDLCFMPEQTELHEMLRHAPSCVGHCISQMDSTGKRELDVR